MDYLLWIDLFLVIFAVCFMFYQLKHELFIILGKYFIQRAMKTPYFHLEGYMERYWLVPYKKSGSETHIGCEVVSFFKRPIAWVLQSLGIAVRVHKILRSDDSRAFHNHPWSFVSIILKGEYIEVTPEYTKDGFYLEPLYTYYAEGSLLHRPDNYFHRLELLNCQPVWTLFITGRKKRIWGFLIEPKHLLPYFDYFKTFKAKDEKLKYPEVKS